MTDEIHAAANVGKQVERMNQIQRETQAHRVALEALRQEMKELQELEADEPLKPRDAESETQSALAINARLCQQQEALVAGWAYARHTDDCMIRTHKTCTCGFAEAANKIGDLLEEN